MGEHSSPSQAQNRSRKFRISEMFMFSGGMDQAGWVVRVISHQAKIGICITYVNFRLPMLLIFLAFCDSIVGEMGVTHNWKI